MPIRLCREFSFLSNLVEATRQGNEIIPLVGAGISVASGIPAIPDIDAYLRNCILLALNTSAGQSPWTPEHQWPSLNYFVGHKQNDFEVAHLHDPFWRSGYGASADWRKALDFLSRIKVGQPKQLGPPNSGIIDSFFRHVTTGKRPNLFHRMLANLAAIGAVELILTINFDELIETAIIEHRSLELTTFVLHHHTELPPYSTFDTRESKVTLLKLHGGRYGLRADDSLDLPASEQEKERFLEYFYRPAQQKKSSASLFLAGMSSWRESLEIAS